jgi:hypothetical protein
MQYQNLCNGTPKGGEKMQVDMHYYGTYAMARASGLNRDASIIIATAAQFVDDNADKKPIRFRDGARIDAGATAHHAFNIKNIDEEDQRQIWVPFHFLPGNEGSSYTERLICRKNSKSAREMVEHNLLLLDEPYALQLIGITAHVYADTFSHYGFSGVSSRKNKVVNDSFDLGSLDPKIESYIRDKEKRFKYKYPEEGGLLDNIKSWFAEGLSGALGHGAAVTYPDRPYLVWSFEYEETNQRCETRNNPQTFLEGCEGLHGLFRKVAAIRPDYAEENFKDFSSIEDIVKEILLTQKDKGGRIEAWKQAAQSGDLFAAGAEPIPPYDENDWHNQRDNLKDKEESSIALILPVYRFYQAASIHRIYVLRKLLPSHGLVVA